MRLLSDGFCGDELDAYVTEPKSFIASECCRSRKASANRFCAAATGFGRSRSIPADTRVRESISVDAIWERCHFAYGVSTDPETQPIIRSIAGANAALLG